MEKLLVEKIENALRYSDIVWPKYGSESIEELAEKIYLMMEEAEK